MKYSMRFYIEIAIWGNDFTDYCGFTEKLPENASVAGEIRWHNLFNIRYEPLNQYNYYIMSLMNLYNNSSILALRNLIATANPELKSHNIAVDYDGEVIVDPELHFPDVSIERYKFCILFKKSSFQSFKKVHLLHAALKSACKETEYAMAEYQMAA